MKLKTLEGMAIFIATALCAQALTAAPQADQTQGQQPGQTTGRSARKIASSLGGVRITKLKGADVKSKDGEDLGKLEDLIVDPQTGQIKFAIVGKGGVLGLGEKAHPVPWQNVTVNSEKQVTLNIDKQKMQTAPTVNSEDYSDLNNPDAVIVIYRFYEVEPSGAPGQATGGVEQGSSSQSQTNSNSNKPNP
jgi:sporulation protein YlmC with PRC-barrel domain